MSTNCPGRVRVLKGVKGVMLDTHEATVIEFRDRFNDLNAVIFRHFSDDMWVFVTKSDPDWHAHLIRLGYKASDIDARQLVSSIT